jgi:3D (Asp-Asp-Asp) domain-containing protein
MTVTSLGLALILVPAYSGQVTNLNKARLSKRTESKKVPASVKYVFNPNLAPGKTKKSSAGKDGETQVTTHELKIGGKVVATKTTKSTSSARPAVIEMSRSGFRTRRESFTRARVMTVEATAYLPTDGSSQGLTATGRKAQYGVIAVDPRVIPLGTLVYVEGYGFAVAADTGGAIKGNRIDVCMHDRKKVYNWGRRKVVIHVFKEKAGKSE